MTEAKSQFRARLYQEWRESLKKLRRLLRRRENEK